MISVIFSSFNGQSTIGQTLESFCQLKSPKCQWDLIVVDNDSTDQTSLIIDSFKSRLPLTKLFVKERGKNFAINAAVSVAVGDVLIFTDDDVIPKFDWLCVAEQCFESHTNYDYFGGKIVPRWPIGRPTWLTDDFPLDMLYAATLRGIEGEAGINEIWGPNMAVRRRIFDLGHRFSTTNGPDGSEKYIMGSETEFLKRISNLGFRGWFCNAMIVQHIIRINQLTPQWIFKRFFRYGRSTYLSECFSTKPTFKLFGVERWLVRKLIVLFICSYIFRLVGNRISYMKCTCQLNLVKGQIHQSRLLTKSEKNVSAI